MGMALLHRMGVMEDEDIEIADAALELGVLDRDYAPLDVYRAFLHELREGALALGLIAETPANQALALATLLHEVSGFSGDKISYDDPANANLLDVIDRRQGLPVALSILYLSVARAQGWVAEGLNVPGHFLIRLGTGADAVVQDPFNGGCLVDKASVEGADVLSNRAILIRLLNNQASRATAMGDLRRALRLHERMTAFAPGFTNLWGERARLEQALGDVAAARGSLVAMSETSRDPQLRQQLLAAVARLARSVNG